MIVDKLSPVSNMASSRSKENVNPRHFQHMMVSQCWWPLQFFGLIVFYFIFILVMVDVLAIDLWQCDVTGRCYCHAAIVFATYVFLFGWCCGHVALLFQNGWWCSYHQADVLALLADVIAILVVVGVTRLINSCTRKCAISVLLYFGKCYCQYGWCCCYVLIDWQMLLPCDWCYCHYFVF